MAELRHTNNVIVFGQIGAGKSSLINMVLGEDLADTSSAAKSCTFDSTPYEVEIGGKMLTLWDTSGLNEADKSGQRAITNLYKLIEQLDQGVSLLVFCVRAPRITDSTVKNYQMFHSAFCQGKVPIALVVTGLEDESSMDAWWQNNKGEFQSRGMSFNGQACITATKGKCKDGKHVFQEEFEESQEKVRKLFLDTCTVYPWKMEKVSWFVAAAKRVLQLLAGFFNLSVAGWGNTLYQVLRKHGVSEEDAKHFSD